MCILTKEGQAKILVEIIKYTMSGHPSDHMLLKLLMQKAVIDTRETSGKFRYNLLSLDTYVTTSDANIEEFNIYVKLNYKVLKARGEQCYDIMSNFLL